MDIGKAGLVVCLTVFIVIGINAALLAALRRGNEASQVDLLRRAAGRVRQPWAEEDEALQELSKRVAGLKSSRPAGAAGTVNDSSSGLEKQPGRGEDE
jgi:hypothetical protein